MLCLGNVLVFVSLGLLALELLWPGRGRWHGSSRLLVVGAASAVQYRLYSTVEPATGLYIALSHAAGLHVLHRIRLRSYLPMCVCLGGGVGVLSFNLCIVF